jgi:hypothetical protein
MTVASGLLQLIAQNKKTKYKICLIFMILTVEGYSHLIGNSAIRSVVHPYGISSITSAFSLIGSIRWKK